MSQETAVVKRAPTPLAPEVEARIREARERNAIVKAIRGTQWGGNIDDRVRGAVAEYCRVNQLDAVRHIEILGGRLYLVAEFYDERGGHLIRDGVIEPLAPDFIHVDERLTKLAAEGDEWAKQEVPRRLRLRITHAAPEEAKATCIWTFRIKASGALVTGVSWCGGGTRKKMTRNGPIDADPIGDLEPTKTSETRARRRAWRKIADVIPAYGAAVKPIEDGATRLAPVMIVDAPVQIEGGAMPDTSDEQHYAGAGGQGKAAETDEEILRQDSDLAQTERDREPGDEETELPLNDRRPRD